MKLVGIRLAALCALLVFSSLASAVEAGDVAPRWRGTDYEGRTVEFPAVTNGKPALLVFWATWCPYCKVFMPYVKRIAQDYAEHGVQVIAINAKEDARGNPGNPRTYFEELDFSPIAILDGDAIAADYGIQYIPGVLIVDGEGRIAWRRPSTDLPAGRAVAELWDGMVRAELDKVLGR
jgi:thiol-disulfide isomerase/thioredoxin